MDSRPRPDGRHAAQLRPVQFVTDFQKHPSGSVLTKFGDTWVLCAASVEDRVPPFMSGSESGWITAEYAMLPSSTHTRAERKSGGREKEIQRLIGRALRAAVNTRALGRRTLTVDCDVVQADGGTRTASVTGGWVALALAAARLERLGLVAKGQVVGEPVAAISVGIIDGEARLDLPYIEDSNADVDMNVVMTESGQLVEVQGTGEKGTFDRKALDKLLDLAHGGIKELCALQRAAVAETVARWGLE